MAHHDPDDISTIDNDDVINMFADVPGTDDPVGDELDLDQIDLDQIDLDQIDLDQIDLGLDDPATRPTDRADDDTPVHGFTLPDTRQVPVVTIDTSRTDDPATTRRPKTRKGRR